MSLYNINIGLHNLLATCLDDDDNLIEGFEDQLESLFKNRKDKILNCVKYIKNQLADSAALKNEEKALQKRRKRKEKKIDNLKKYLSANISAGEKFEDKQAKLSTRKSTKLEIVDPEVLPKEYFTIIPEQLKPDKRKIKQALKDGDVAGVELIENVNLVIK